MDHAKLLEVLQMRMIVCAVPIDAGLGTSRPMNLGPAAPRRVTTAPPLGYQTISSQAHRGSRSMDVRRISPLGSLQLWFLSQDAPRFAVGD